jgi:hypothetical protein
MRSQRKGEDKDKAVLRSTRKADLDRDLFPSREEEMW